MKLRRLTVPVLAAVLLLSGCNNVELLSRPAPDFDKSYQMSAQIDYGSYSAAADITRSGKDNWQFCFSEPSYLMGMELTLADGTLTASLGDISITADKNDVYTMLPEVISAALDTLPSAAAESITENEGVLTITTDVLGDKTVVTADSSGNLLTLKCPSKQLSVKFSEQEEIAVTETAETFEFIIE